MANIFDAFDKVEVPFGAPGTTATDIVEGTTSDDLGMKPLTSHGVTTPTTPVPSARAKIQPNPFDMFDVTEEPKKASSSADKAMTWVGDRFGDLTKGVESAILETQKAPRVPSRLPSAAPSKTAAIPALMEFQAQIPGIMYGVAEGSLKELSNVVTGKGLQGDIEKSVEHYSYRPRSNSGQKFAEGFGEVMEYGGETVGQSAKSIAKFAGATPETQDKVYAGARAIAHAVPFALAGKGAIHYGKSAVSKTVDVLKAKKAAKETPSFEQFHEELKGVNPDITPAESAKFYEQQFGIKPEVPVEQPQGNPFVQPEADMFPESLGTTPFGTKAGEAPAWAVDENGIPVRRDFTEDVQRQEQQPLQEAFDNQAQLDALGQRAPLGVNAVVPRNNLPPEAPEIPIAEEGVGKRDSLPTEPVKDNSIEYEAPSAQGELALDAAPEAGLDYKGYATPKQGSDFVETIPTDVTADTRGNVPAQGEMFKPEELPNKDVSNAPRSNLMYDAARHDELSFRSIEGNLTPKEKAELKLLDAMEAGEIPKNTVLVKQPLPEGITPKDIENADKLAQLHEKGDTRGSLAHIANNSTNPFFKAVAKRLLDLKDLNPKLLVEKDMFDWKNGTRYDLAGRYRKSEHSVAISSTVAGNEMVFIHEMVHAATASIVRAVIEGKEGLNQTQKLAVQELQDMFNLVKARLNSEGITEKQHYGITNLDEFIAESHSNGEFQTALKGMSGFGKTSWESAWHQFVDVVSRILGLKGKDMLSSVMDTSARLMDATTESQRKMYMENLRDEYADTSFLPKDNLKTEKQIADYINSKYGSRTVTNPTTGKAVSSVLKDRAVLDKALDWVNKHVMDNPVGREVVEFMSPLSGLGDSISPKVMEAIGRLREATITGNNFAKGLGDAFSKEELNRMAKAQIAEELAAATGTKAVGGWDSLTPDMRKYVEAIHKDYTVAKEEAIKAGVLTAESAKDIYYARIAVNTLEGKDFAEMLNRHLTKRQTNTLSTKLDALRQRKHMTVQETNEALRSIFGKDAHVLEDYRIVPLMTAKLKQVTAARNLLNYVQEFGKDMGVPAVIAAKDGVRAPEGYIQMGAPFGKAWVHPDFASIAEVFAPRNMNILARGLLTVKYKTMSMIMFNPLIHNAVIVAKAVPFAGWKALGYGQMMGSKLAKDPAFYQEALRNNLVPANRVRRNMGLTDVTDSYSLNPGNSWTAKAIGKVFGEQGARAVDKFGEFWHDTLLWDRVTDLQFHIHKEAKDFYIQKGLTPEAAGVIAARLGNEYGGVIPRENLSGTVHTLMDLALFSKSFTGTNLAIYKDVLAGLPKPIQAQVKAYSGEAGLRTAQKGVRASQTYAMIVDVGLTIALTNMIGYWLANGQGEGYEFRKHFARYMHEAEKNPMLLLNPVAFAKDMLPSSYNEPGKEGRIKTNLKEKDGQTYYAKVPFGKVGEDLMMVAEGRWGELYRNKMSGIMKSAVETITGRDILGREIYSPDEGEEYHTLKNIGRLMQQYIKNNSPYDAYETLKDVHNGNINAATKTKATLGLVAGVSLSKGAKGGPQQGVIQEAYRIQKFADRQIAHDAQKLMQAGKVQEAYKYMAANGWDDDKIDSFVDLNLGSSDTYENRLDAFLDKATPEQMRRIREVNR